jgi:hypothetical protein
MTKILLAALVAAMLALTGLVAYNNYSAVKDVTAPAQVAATDDDACPACCEKETATEACAGCPLGEKGGCCQEAKPACCSGDAAVKPRATGPKAEAKKE